MSRYSLRRNDHRGSPLRAGLLTRRSVVLGASCLALAAGLGAEGAAARPFARRERDGTGSGREPGTADFVMRDGWVLRADDLPSDLPPGLSSDLPIA